MDRWKKCLHLPADGFENWLIIQTVIKVYYDNEKTKTKKTKQSDHVTDVLIIINQGPV